MLLMFLALIIMPLPEIPPILEGSFNPRVEGRGGNSTLGKRGAFYPREEGAFYPRDPEEGGILP